VCIGDGKKHEEWRNHRTYTLGQNAVRSYMRCGIQARAEEVELLWGNGQDHKYFLLQGTALLFQNLITLISKGQSEIKRPKRNFKRACSQVWQGTAKISLQGSPPYSRRLYTIRTLQDGIQLGKNFLSSRQCRYLHNNDSYYASPPPPRY